MARPRRRGPTYAPPDAIPGLAAEWSNEILECRDTGHHWQPLRASHVKRLRYYSIVHACARCGTVRYREMSESGHVYAQTYAYAEGYVSKGLGRIVGEARDAVRLAAIGRLDVQEIRGRAKESDEPRFSATRKATEEGAPE